MKKLCDFRTMRPIQEAFRSGNMEEILRHWTTNPIAVENLGLGVVAIHVAQCFAAVQSGHLRLDFRLSIGLEIAQASNAFYALEAMDFGDVSDRLLGAVASSVDSLLQRVNTEPFPRMSA